MAKKTMDEMKSKAVEVKPTISLDEIIREYSQIANELELGELTEELEERLLANAKDIERKMLGYRYIILNNEAKIDTIYKPEIEKLQNRIKKFERTNAYLKERACIAAQIFGEDNKYKSDTINVSAVETCALELDEELVNQSLEQIRECILNGNPEDITVETNITTTSLTFKDISPEQASAIIQLLRNNDESELSDILLFSDLKVSLKGKEAKELVQEVEEQNENLIAQYEHYLESVSYEEKDNVPKPELRVIEFKGLKLKYNHYPRFS